MKIEIVCFLSILLSTRLLAATGEMWMSGKVKSFNEKTVVVEKDGKLYEFDIKRIKDKTKLRTGSDINVPLSSSTGSN